MDNECLHSVAVGMWASLPTSLDLTFLKQNGDDSTCLVGVLEELKEINHVECPAQSSAQKKCSLSLPTIPPSR